MAITLDRYTNFLLICLLANNNTGCGTANALSSLNVSPPIERGIRFRPGRRSDELQISLAMARNLMNPLGIDSQRFIVAVHPESSSPPNSGEEPLLGWAQLRPIGASVRDASVFDSPRGSGAVERDVEDEIWDEFEEDLASEVPNGFESLPWTKEYREFAVAAEGRRERRASLYGRAERDKEMDRNQLWELASVYVVPTWRKKGIGTELISRTMNKHVMLGRNYDDVFLLTLDSTKEWYRSFGFEVTDKPPAAMALEIAAGGILTKFLGAKLISMQGGYKPK